MILASGFSWFHLLPGGEDPSGPLAFMSAHDHGYLVWTSWAVCLLLIGLALVARAGLQRAAARQGITAYEADETLTPRTFAELYVGGIMGFMSDALGHDDVKRFLPLIGGLFTYILANNLLALLPGFQPPTDNINTNVGMAVIVLVTYWGVGLMRDAKGFIGHILGPVLLLAPLMVLIELIGLVAVRPASLAIRLTGNIFGDHTVFNIMSDLVPLGVPAIFLGLALLVSVIQAFVFSLLTTIYISLSLPHGDHDEHH